MASPALARPDLEALLRQRKLDRHVALASELAPAEDAAPVQDSSPVAETSLVLATGIPSLDERLGGGLPRGQTSEIVGPRSSGRPTVVRSALAAATGRGELVALVDALDMFDPESAAAGGVVLERLLWLRGDAISHQGDTAPAAMRRVAPGRGPMGVGTRASAFERLLDHAVKAVNLVLQAGGFDLVVFDVAEVPAEALRRVPFTTWFRLQRAIEGSRTSCLLVGPAPISRSAEGVSIQLSRGTPQWSSRLFRGLDIQARLVRARQPDERPVRFATGA
jgi:hypothetical protein